MWQFLKNSVRLGTTLIVTALAVVLMLIVGTYFLLK